MRLWWVNIHKNNQLRLEKCPLWSVRPVRSENILSFCYILLPTTHLSPRNPQSMLWAPPTEKNPINTCCWEWDWIETQWSLLLSLFGKANLSITPRLGWGQALKQQHNFPSSWNQSLNVCTVTPRLSGILLHPENHACQPILPHLFPKPSSIPEEFFFSYFATHKIVNFIIYKIDASSKEPQTPPVHPHWAVSWVPRCLTLFPVEMEFPGSYLLQEETSHWIALFF